MVREELEGSKTTSDRGCVYVQTAAVKRVRLTYGLRSRGHRRFPPSFPPVADIAAVRLLLWVSYCGAMATGHAQSSCSCVQGARDMLTPLVDIVASENFILLRPHNNQKSPYEHIRGKNTTEKLTVNRNTRTRLNLTDR